MGPGRWDLLPHPKASAVATRSYVKAEVYRLIGHWKVALVSALNSCMYYLKHSVAAISLVAASQVGTFVSFDEYSLSKAKLEVSMELFRLPMPMATLAPSEHFEATETH